LQVLGGYYVSRVARAIWSGSISFGLVNVPVKLFSATESHRVGFHEFEHATGARIRYKRVSERSGREVPWKSIERGYEVRKGHFVVLSDEELAAAAPGKTQAIEIEQFVSLGEIDPISWDQTYFVLPDGAAAAKAYALLRKAMGDRQRVAIGRFVMRTKEYVVCLRPYENIVALETMFFPDEVRQSRDVGAPPKIEVNRRELQMAERLIDMLTSPWDPSRYRDTYSERVMALVRKKDKGQEIVAPEEAAEPARVVDLMDALKRTLAGAKAGRPEPRASRAGARGGRRQPAGARRPGGVTGRRRARSAA
jgi:DNA end-binding protein Ku